jgi:flagellar motor protein MotB
MSTISYSENPVADSSTAEGRGDFRRVKIIVLI